MKWHFIKQSLIRQPVAVTVYDIDGGRPAAKVSFRCMKCSTVYNYTTWGRKVMEGKKYGGYISCLFPGIL